MIGKKEGGAGAPPPYRGPAIRSHNSQLTNITNYNINKKHQHHLISLRIVCLQPFGYISLGSARPYSIMRFVLALSLLPLEIAAFTIGPAAPSNLLYTSRPSMLLSSNEDGGWYDDYDECKSLPCDVS